MFQNVQNRKLYQAKSAGEGEPEKNEFSFIKKNHLACSLNLRKDFSEIIKKITWLAPDFGKVSQTSIGKRREGSCLCISLNLWIH